MVLQKDSLQEVQVFVFFLISYVLNLGFHDIVKNWLIINNILL